MSTDVKVEGDVSRRDQIRALLASGLKTETFPRADTAEEVQSIIGRLRTPGLSIKDKLIISGFSNHTVEHGGLEQPCETCMYYLVHRRYCVLPELDCPVEPTWSCRLWRI